MIWFGEEEQDFCWMHKTKLLLKLDTRLNEGMVANDKNEIQPIR